jgi:LHFPL tetraspan subfamily member protein
VVRRYAKTLGLFTRCVLIKGREQCAPFIGMNEAEGGAGFPIPWQISMIFLVLGVVVGILTTLAALLGCCVQAVCGKKSLYSVAGAAQAAAGKASKCMPWVQN